MSRSSRQNTQGQGGLSDKVKGGEKRMSEEKITETAGGDSQNTKNRTDIKVIKVERVKDSRDVHVVFRLGRYEQEAYYDTENDAFYGDVVRLNLTQKDTEDLIRQIKEQSSSEGNPEKPEWEYMGTVQEGFRTLDEYVLKKGGRIYTKRVRIDMSPELLLPDPDDVETLEDSEFYTVESASSEGNPENEG